MGRHGWSRCWSRGWSRGWSRSWLRGCLALALASKASLAHAAEVEPRVSYVLSAHLVARAEGGFTLEGQSEVTLENHTERALEIVPWHLYMNAFRADNPTTQDVFLEGRATQAPQALGNIEVSRFLDARTRRALPFGDPTLDTDPTTATVRLETPVGPGEAATFELEWRAVLPRLSQRTGYAGSFVFAGQWFPKVAKLERNGEWAQFAFHPQAEFYANFGDYDVTVDVPPAHVVGASGTLVSTSTGETKTVHYRAKDVHDFAWVAWPDFVDQTDVIEGVSVRLLAPPGHGHNATVTWDTLRVVLPWLNDWLGPYPLPTLTVVHPPSIAEGAGGMEYPGLITTGGGRLDGYLGTEIERVVVHELAHQWFYGSLASNEYRYPFLDEGLTTYVENRAMARFSRSPFARLVRFWTELDQRAYSAAYGQDVPIASSGAAFPSYSHLAALAYTRAAALFESCSRAYGEPFDQAVRAYARKFRQAHPTPEDLLATVAEHAGAAAAETLRHGLFERGHVNLTAFNLRSRKNPNGDGYVNRVLLSRHGELQFPTTVDIYEPGYAVRRETWNATETTKVLEFTTTAPASAVCLDRERRIVIEDSRADNCATAARSALPRYWGSLLAWLQTLLSVLAW